MKHIIELSGPDEVGKSTQAELLTYGPGLHAANFGGYGAYSDRFPDATNQEQSWGWWFANTTLEEIGGTLVDAYNCRQARAEESPYDFVVVERGARMLKAQLIANFATRREVEVADVQQEVDEFISSRIMKPQHTPRTEVTLRPDQSWAQATASVRQETQRRLGEGSSFSREQDDFYAQYQRNLLRALQEGHDSLQEGAPMVAVNTWAADVQTAIRSLPDFASLGLGSRPVTDDALRVLGLSGLSECGKSRVAEELAAHHNFTRLKLGFFNAQASTGIERYARAERVALKIVEFLAHNRHLQLVTVESLHQPRLAAQCKLLLGERWQTVWLEVPSATRRSRLIGQFPEDDPVALIAEQEAKDTAKRAHGAERHRMFADMVIDNSGSLEATIHTIKEHLTHA